MIYALTHLRPVVILVLTLLCFGLGAVVASRHATNALFELKTLLHCLIVSGHDGVPFAPQGAILGVWH
jgi:hypothetical protein